jgi:hypothetical protein
MATKFAVGPIMVLTAWRSIPLDSIHYDSVAFAGGASALAGLQGVPRIAGDS